MNQDLSHEELLEAIQDVTDEQLREAVADIVRGMERRMDRAQLSADLADIGAVLSSLDPGDLAGRIGLEHRMEEVWRRLTEKDEVKP